MAMIVAMKRSGYGKQVDSYGDDDGYGKKDDGYDYGKKDDGYGYVKKDDGYGKKDDGYGYGKKDVGYGKKDDGYGKEDDGYGKKRDGYGKKDDGYGKKDNGYGKKDNGYGKKDDGYGKKDDGYGKKDDGYGKKDDGYGKKDDGYGYKPTPEPKPRPTPEPTRYATPKPTPYPTAYVPLATPPPPFVPPVETKYGPAPAPACASTWKPNSAKYMAYVCSSLYASATKWATNNCAAYYVATSSYDDKSLYQAQLCTYWSQRSVFRVVTSCFIEAHLRNEFITKYGKQGPGKWFCKYSDFIAQVNDCYSSSLDCYPLGKSLNSLEAQVAALNPPSSNMPPFKFTGASIAMCAYYNKDQVYNTV
ncbi:hypothetical protein THRCLA_21863 [Thraustotheca clavata]|uniref:Uncharacterized protein n=1 Tax=Thraustotheca clavata TaxID=74557 RepID=A0A1V9ZLK5_9STRA|nr:hypothetical protein THRCLA_21863 [Thraustotheca clavata]